MKVELIDYVAELRRISEGLLKRKAIIPGAHDGLLIREAAILLELALKDNYRLIGEARQEQLNRANEHIDRWNS